MSSFLVSLLNICIYPYKIITSPITMIPLVCLLVVFMLSLFNRLLYGVGSKRK